MSETARIYTIQKGMFRFRDSLLSYVREQMPRDLGRHVDAADVIQDIYIKAIAVGGDWVFGGDAVLLRGLKTIARNHLTDLLRQSRAAKRGGGHVVGEDSTEMLLAQAHLYERTPSESAMSHEVHALVQRTMDSLPPEQAYALRLRYFAGMQLEEVGHCMSRSSGAAEQLCRRALVELRQRLVPNLLQI